MIHRIRTAVIPLMIACVLCSVAHACPTCKEGLNENGGNLVQGYFWSIIFMMSMPFLIFGGLASMFYLDVRRARRRQETEVITSALNVGGSN